MKNKVKIFDRGVFLEALNQLKIVGIIACAIYLSAGILTPIGYLIDGTYYDKELKKWMEITFDAEYFIILAGILYVFIPVMMMVIFFWMNKRNSCDFYHAIPVRRETMFISTIAAVFTWSVIIIAAAVIVPLAIVGIHPLMATDMAVFWKIILYIFAGIILMMGVFALGITITGNGFTNVVASLMILFVPRAILTFIVMMTEDFMPFIVLNGGNSLLNSQYNLLVSPVMKMFDYGSNTISLYQSAAYTGILGLIYLAVACIMFKKRKSEVASQPSAYNIVQIICRMIPAYFFSLIGTYFLLDTTMNKSYEIEMYFVAVVWYVVALLVYFIYELITTRRWRKVGISARQLPIFVGIVIISGLSIGLGTYLSMNREISVEDIEYIEIEPLEGTAYFSGQDSVVIRDEEIYKLIKEAYENQIDDYYGEYYSYYEENEVFVGINQGGLTFYRKVYLNSLDMEKLMTVYVNTLDNSGKNVELPEYDSHNMDLYLEIDGLSEQQVTELYDILQEEAQSLSYRELFNLDEYSVMSQLSIFNYNDYSASWDEIVIPISDITPKSKAYLLSALFEEANNIDVKEYDYLFEEDSAIVGIDMNFTVVTKESTESFYVGRFKNDGTAGHITGVENIYEMLHSLKGDNLIIIDGYLEVERDGDIWYEWIGDIYRADDELAERLRDMATIY